MLRVVFTHCLLGLGLQGCRELEDKVGEVYTVVRVVHLENTQRQKEKRCYKSRHVKANTHSTCRLEAVKMFLRVHETE